MGYFALLGFLLMASLFTNGVLLVKNIGQNRELEKLKEKIGELEK
jgi:hypothetical protein